MSAPKREYIITIHARGGMTAAKLPCTLEALQKIVGGYIETVPIQSSGAEYIMILDEEGKLTGKEYNSIASLFLRPHDYAVGDAAIVRRQGENLVGLTQKETILREFFGPTKYQPKGTWRHYYRTDVSPEEEEYDCKVRIKEYKERMQMGNIERRIYQETGASGRYYFVHDMGGGRFKVHTAYKLGDMHDPDKIYPSFYFRSCSTFEEAQVALDLTARKKDWTEVQPDEPESQLPEGGFDELYPEEDPSPAAQDDGTEEDLPSLRSTDHDYDPDPEEDESAEDLVEEENHGIAIEDHTSLRMEAFNEIMDLADARLNMALRKCLSSESTERFDLTIKITFEAAQGRVKPVMQESGYKFEPASYKVKTGVLDDIEIVLNSNGDPVILNNRPKQMTMEDYYGQD